MGIVHIGLFAGAYALDLFSYSIVGDLLSVLGVIASVMIILCVCEMGMIFEISVPTIGYFIASKWWPVDIFFYPSKVLKRFKK